jgi:hypothetical protein
MKKQKPRKRLKEILAPMPKEKTPTSASVIKDLIKLAASPKDQKSVIIHYGFSDAVARATAEYVVESGKTVNFDNRYSARKDRAHVPGQQDHVHVLLKGKQLCVINIDGTPSHKSDINEILKHLRPKLKEMGVKIVESQLIVEAADLDLASILRANIRQIETDKISTSTRHVK